MSGVTRRKVLTAIGGGAALAAAGGAVAIGTTSPAGLVRATIEHAIGPVRISEADLVAFTEDFMAQKPWIMPTAKLAAGYQLALTLGADRPALAVVSDADRAALENFSRRILGVFFERTDVGWRTGPDDPVHYAGDLVCNNPFAKVA